MDFVVDDDDDSYKEEVAPPNNDFSSLAVLSTPKGKSAGTLATCVPEESGYDSDEEYDKIDRKLKIIPSMQEYFDQRDAKNNRVHEEQLREQTNELVEQSSRQGATLMNRMDRLERSNKSDSRGLGLQMTALVETLADQKGGRMMRSLHDSKVKLKQAEAELQERDACIANLQSRLEAAEGRTTAEGDDANGGSDVLAGVVAVEVQEDIAVENLDRTVAEDAKSAKAFTSVGGECNFVYGIDVEGGEDNGPATKLPFLDRQKEAEEEHVRRKNVAKDEKEIAAWTADALPGQPSSQYANTKPKIDTGRTIAKASSTPVAIDNKLRSTVSDGRPPAAPPSTRKSSRRMPAVAERNALATPKKVSGATTTPTRSTRSATKRGAATVGESPSDGPQPKRARRSPRSASTK